MKKIEDIIKTPNLEIFDNDATGFIGRYYDKKDKKWLTYIFSWGAGWEHLSVSTPTKTPTWEQMCMMKEIFFEAEEVCVEYHPKKSEYVNNHSHCLHIWKPIDKELPTPPSILVGLKEINLC